MTLQEVKLWSHLRSWRARGFHFRRQSPRQDCIVDFVCMKHRLAIEVDGGQHNFDQHQDRDAIRDAKLAERAFRVPRFWNTDIDCNLSGVLQSIHCALTEATPHPAACGGHPPPSGEG